MVNYLLAFQYLAEAAQAALLIQSSKFTNASVYANVGLQMVSIFDPALAKGADYATAQQVMASLAAAEGGATGQVGKIPFQSNGQKVALYLTVGPA